MIETFLKPATPAEALAMKKDHGPAARYLAGGTLVNNRLLGPACKVFIDVTGLGLNRILDRPDGLVIGAGATFQDLRDHPDVPVFLKTAAGFMTARRIRNVATLGGNVAAGRGDSFMLPGLIAMQARVRLTGRGDTGIEDYLAGGRDDLIEAVILPPGLRPPAQRRFTRQANGPVVVHTAVSLRGAADQPDAVIIAVGGVADSIIRLRSVEEGIAGGRLGHAGDIAREVARAIAPEDGLQGSGAYKKYLCGVLVDQCLEQCRQGAALI